MCCRVAVIRFGRRVVSLAAAALLLAAALPAATFTTVNPSPNEPDLLEILDSLYGAGTYQRIDDDSDKVWQAESISVVPRATYAGATQQMGYCLVCDGSDDINLIPQVWGFTTFALGDFVPGEALLDPDGEFRFFSMPTNHPSVGRVLSDPDFPAPGSQPQDYMVTYQLIAQPEVFILAFEDWLVTNPTSDLDFNDLVVQATVRTSPPTPPIPEPSTWLLFGAGLVALSRLRPRRKS